MAKIDKITFVGTPEGKREICDAKFKHIISAEPEEIEGKSTKDETAYGKYCEALEICKKLHEQGKMDFEADDPEKRYSVHEITICWKREKDWDDCVAPPVRELGNLCDKMEELSLLDDQKWLFYKTIYKPTERDVS